MSKSATYIGLIAATFGLMAADVSAQGRGRGQGRSPDRVEAVRPGAGQARADARGATRGGGIADAVRGADRDPRQRDGSRDCSIAEILLGCRDDRARRDDRDRGDDRVRYEGNRDVRGPAFCRSGAGHPVHGRSWCVNKGFGLGNDQYRDSRILRMPAEPSGRGIADILDALSRRGRG